MVYGAFYGPAVGPTVRDTARRLLTSSKIAPGIAAGFALQAVRLHHLEPPNHTEDLDLEGAVSVRHVHTAQQAGGRAHGTAHAHQLHLRAHAV
eukprot:359802-Chlamydomonas_euryale.AAC.8